MFKHANEKSFRSCLRPNILVLLRMSIVRIINALSDDWNLNFVAALILHLNSNKGLLSH